jgi:phosphotransferase system HPr (HPr) family protein
VARFRRPEMMSVPEMSDSAFFERSVTLGIANGLHLVPCSKIAQLLRSYAGIARIRHEEYDADAKSIFDMVRLQALQGRLLTVRVEGPDAEAMVTQIALILETESFEKAQT